MPYKVEIKRLADGLTRIVDFPDVDWMFPSELGTGSLWLWGEGNYGCDCNRHIFFMDAEEDYEDIPCSETLYTAVKAILPDGTEVILDADNHERNCVE